VFQSRVPAALVVSLLAVFPTAGCYQGFEGTVNSQGPTGNGTDFEVGRLLVQNTTLVADASGSGTAALVMTVINRGEAEDTLVTAKIDSLGHGTGGTPIDVPVGSAVQLGGPDQAPGITFTGLTQPAGTYADVTVDFEDAGSATVPIAIVPGTGYYEDYAPAPGTAGADDEADADAEADDEAGADTDEADAEE
jgi:hypothetical protein